MKQPIEPPAGTIKLGVSACLLGEKVRYDGGHQQDHYLTDTLAKYFDFVPVCPETECGMPTPREAMRLEGDPAAPRLMTRTTRIDKTGQMLAFCAQRVKELESEGLCGFIFKKDSPSSGLSGVKIYQSCGKIETGTGLFAAAVARYFPLLPLVESEVLKDICLRQEFIAKVIRYRTNMISGTTAIPELGGQDSHC